MRTRAKVFVVTNANTTLADQRSIFISYRDEAVKYGMPRAKFAELVRELARELADGEPIAPRDYLYAAMETAYAAERAFRGVKREPLAGLVVFPLRV